MSSKSKVISKSKSSLKDDNINLEIVIGRIRDILRTEGITGMDSINHCIMFLLCRSLDTKMCESFEIPEKFTFENIMNDDDGEELGDSEFYEKFYDKNKIKESLMGYMINSLGFVNIKGNFKMVNIQNIKKILSLLGKLNLKDHDEQYDIIGTIYEVHLKSGTSNAMRDLGQYFTNRKVIEYMVGLCEPTMNKGLIETIVDPTMGTGGFLTMAIKYLNKKYKNINWDKNKNRIYGFDIDENVRNMAIVNCLLETGEKMDTTLRKVDTLNNDMQLEKGRLEKAKIILANEPMGLKGVKHANCCDRIKDFGIGGTKAEPLFLQLFMEALDDGGRCAVVVPDGVLFNENKLYKDTRKHLIENFNLKKVVTLNGDFFINTGVKTSVLFFVNDGNKTEEVDFCQIALKDDKIEETSIVKVSYDDIVEKSYYLFVNKYNVSEIIKYDGVEYILLRDICSINYGSSKPVEDGIYPMMGGGEKISKYVDKYNVEKNTIIIARSGNPGYVTLTYDKSYIASYAFYLEMSNNKVDTLYLYYYLKNIQEEIQTLGKGTCVKNLNRDILYDIKIPVPSLEIQKEIVERLDLLSENIKTMEKNIEQFKNVIKYYVDVNTMGENEKRIGDICDTESGEYIKKDEFVEGSYPVYGGGDASSFINKHNRSNTFIISKDGVSKNCVRYVDGEFFLNHHGWTLKYKLDEINNKYMYYWFYSNQETLYNLASGSAQKGINRNSFYDVIIKLPPLKKQKNMVNYCDNISDMIKKLEKQIEDNKQLMKDILEGYLKRCEKNDDNIEVVDDQENDNISEKPIKKGSKKVKKDIIESDEDNEHTTSKKVIKSSKKVNESSSKKVTIKKNIKPLNTQSISNEKKTITEQYFI